MRDQSSISVVTSVNKLYFDRYGKRLARSAVKCLPDSASLRIYCEASNEGLTLDAYDIGEQTDRIGKVDLFNETTLSDYLPRARPIVEDKIGCPVSENPDERKAERGYSYKWDALTFGKKGFSIAHALRTTEADYLFWVDADVVFFRPMSKLLLQRLFRGRAEVVYFGRKGFHSETGFIGFKMTSACREFGERYCAQWEELRVFESDEGWTDCHVFDTVLAEMTSEGRLKAHNLSWTPTGHVMAHSPLSMYFDHLKGDRKEKGQSWERNRYGLRRITEPVRFWLWKVGLIG